MLLCNNETSPSFGFAYCLACYNYPRPTITCTSFGCELWLTIQSTITFVPAHSILWKEAVKNGILTGAATCNRSVLFPAMHLIIVKLNSAHDWCIHAFQGNISSYTPLFFKTLIFKFIGLAQLMILLICTVIKDRKKASLCGNQAPECHIQVLCISQSQVGTPLLICPSAVWQEGNYVYV